MRRPHLLRHLLVGAVPVIALLLATAGCGSTTGTAVVASPGAVMPAAGGATGSSGAVITSAGSLPTPDRSTVASVTSSTATTEPGPPSSPTSETTSSDESTTTDATDTAAANLDQQSLAWFSALCTAFAPFVGQDDPSYDDAKPVAAQRESAVTYYRTIHDVMAGAATTLDVLPAPTVEGGDSLDQTVPTVFAKVAEVAGEQTDLVLAAQDGPAVKKAIDTANEALTTAVSGLGDVESVMEQPGLRSALKQIPACAPLTG